MKRFVLVYFLALVGLVLLSCKSTNINLEKLNSTLNQPVDEYVKLDPENISPINNGVFEGWGTSLCWWGNRLGGDEKISDEAAKLFFDVEEGLGLNIVRYNIGGGDDPTHNHITRGDSIMPGFMVLNESTGQFEYDWTADQRQRNVLSKIVATVDKNLIIEFFSNSPPYFMTNSGCSSGSVHSVLGNIRDDMNEAFAEYLAEVTLNLQKLDGIKVASLEPMNEPRSVSWSAQNAKQEGCHVGIGDPQSKLLILTRKALDKRGLYDVIVSGTDESGSGFQASSIQSLSKEALDSLGRINTHTYWGEKYNKLRNQAVRYGKSLWVSETDGVESVGTGNGQMGPAINFAQKIIEDMNGLKPTAWIIWQAIANYSSSKPFNNIPEAYGISDMCSGFWGTAIADFDKEEIVLSKKYYGWGQLTKYIRPGDYVIFTDSKNYMASYNKDKNTVSIVCVNPEPSDKLVRFDLSSFQGKWKNKKTIRTSGKNLNEGENLAEISTEIMDGYDNAFTASLLANSITTFVLEGAE